ncbi:hypothetical protein P618_200929 [Holospora obtusa F1]|uniref:Uncharacterized protein n=1 Tax=Holospora obtusa F1 TaxID=1399147 RepID=W6TD76_HOLOB|nr:hypothetical protein P618_200929 [Holospora obtusa F1]
MSKNIQMLIFLINRQKHAVNHGTFSRFMMEQMLKDIKIVKVMSDYYRNKCRSHGQHLRYREFKHEATEEPRKKYIYPKNSEKISVHLHKKSMIKT